MKILLIKSFADKPWRNPETYHRIEESLRRFWSVDTIIPKSVKGLCEKVQQLRERTETLFVFNIAEFIDENSQTGLIPEILEGMDVKHLGSNTEAILTGLNKAETKNRLVLEDIPTPEFFVQHPGDVYPIDRIVEIGFPLFVKPLNTGGHLGVSSDSIVSTQNELEAAVNHIHQAFKQPALIEAFIDDASMREFSVGIVGNGPHLFSPVEIDFDAMPTDERILSFDAAQKDLEVIVPVKNPDLRDELNHLALKTFRAVGAKDYSRIDLRMDQNACYVLEINTMPGLGPHSFLPEAMADQHGLDYPKLIQRLVEVSLQA